MSMQELLARAHEILNFELFQFGGEAITPFTIASMLAMLIVAWWVSRLVQRGVARAAQVRGVDNDGSVAVLQRLTHYLVMLIGVGIALETVGINLSALFTAGAVFAVGIGFAMQTLAQNFVSGVILLLERVIKPGDIIEVDGRTVRILELGIRSTRARTRDDEDVIIPNSTLVVGTVKNLTLSDRDIRIRAPVGVAYESDLRAVHTALEAAGRSMSWRLDRGPVVLLTGFGSSSIDFEVSVWTNDPWRVPQLRTELFLAVSDHFKQAGITIAFPQLDLHLDEPVVEALRVVS